MLAANVGGLRPGKLEVERKLGSTDRAGRESGVRKNETNETKLFEEFQTGPWHWK